MKHEVVYKTAEELNITEAQRQALIEVAGELSRELHPSFNMSRCDHCLCGLVNYRLGKSCADGLYALPTRDLFYAKDYFAQPRRDDDGWGLYSQLDGAKATYNFLLGAHTK